MSQILQVYRMRVLVNRSWVFSKPYCAHSRFAPYEYSRAIKFIDQLPMTLTDKIHRGALRDPTVCSRSLAALFNGKPTLLLGSQQQYHLEGKRFPVLRSSMQMGLPTSGSL